MVELQKDWLGGNLVRGTRAECASFLSRQSCHYVYVLRRPDGRPFYVGKGEGQRVFAHENEARHPNGRRSNAHKLNVIRSIWNGDQEVQYEIDFVCEAASGAYQREAELIAKWGRLHEGGPLTNLAPGGGTDLGSSPISKGKHAATLAGTPADNPERATLNRFVLGIAPMRSVVLKPISQFTPKPTLPFPKSRRSPTLRQAVALAASAAANGIRLNADCTLGRRVTVDDVDGFVENGVSCDILTSGLAEIVSAKSPAEELFKLSEANAIAVVDLIGRKKAHDLGIL